MIRILAMTALLLTGCAHSAKPTAPHTVVVLGNKTAPVVCDRSDAVYWKAEAGRWKAYAETLEGALP